MDSWIADSMRSPRRSTFTMPSAAQSSLSHWITTRPGIVAGSSRTTSSRRPAGAPVPPVDVLDDDLAALVAGKIEIDVRPFAARFGEEALEEEIHLHGIDRGDAERIADRAVRGGAAALHEDVVRATELHDVPH